MCASGSFANATPFFARGTGKVARIVCQEEALSLSPRSSYCRLLINRLRVVLAKETRVLIAFRELTRRGQSGSFDVFAGTAIIGAEGDRCGIGFPKSLLTRLT